MGSIVVEELGGGNLQISKSHTPSEAFVIERADIGDAVHALRACRNMIANRRDGR